MKQSTISKELFAKAKTVFPGGVNSPVRAFTNLPVPPLMIERGKGDTIYDVDGRSFIDFCMSWGALPLGHAHQSVVEAAQKQMEKGSSFGLTTPLEEELGSLIKRHVPSIEKMRFVSSGTEATMTALRLARGYTGKDKCIKFNGNYHGHADPFLVQAGSSVSTLPGASSLGVPKGSIDNTLSLPFNNEEMVKEAFASHSDIGAVIVEPIAANMGVIPSTRKFLQTLREETEKAGALLIFDEVISGFRVGLSGAQGLYGIEPDLTCFGKVIGGGFPVAAFGGKKEVMDLLSPLGSVYQAGTLSGNSLGLAAGLATLKALEENGAYEELQRKTQTLLQPVERLIYEKSLPATINRVGSVFTIFLGPRKVRDKEDLKGLDQALFSKFYEYLFTRGVYFSPAQMEGCFLSLAHEEASLLKTQKALLEFFHAM